MASSSAYSATGEDAAALMAMGVPQPGQAVAQYTIMKQQPAEGATDPMAAMAAAVQQASRAAGIDPAVGMAALQTMPSTRRLSRALLLCWTAWPWIEI